MSEKIRNVQKYNSSNNSKVELDKKKQIYFLFLGWAEMDLCFVPWLKTSCGGRGSAVPARPSSEEEPSGIRALSCLYVRLTRNSYGKGLKRDGAPGSR